MMFSTPDWGLHLEDATLQPELVESILTQVGNPNLFDQQRKISPRGQI